MMRLKKKCVEKVSFAFLVQWCVFFFIHMLAFEVPSLYGLDCSDKPVCRQKTLPTERCRFTLCVAHERKYTSVDRTFPLVDDFKKWLYIS